MLEPIVMVALAIAMCLVPFDLLIGAYLLLAINLEAYRFAAGGWLLSVESLATAVVAFRTLIEWGIDPGAKSALKEGRWFAWAISLFVLAGALSALFSMDPLRSWKAVLRYSTYPVVAIGILRTGQRKGGGWIRNLCLASAVVPCLCALLQVWDPNLNFGDRDWTPAVLGTLAGPLNLVIPRVNGTLNNANALGVYMLVIAGWGLSTSPALRGRKKPFALLLGAAFCFLMIFLTFCRSAWVCAALMLVGWAILNARARVVLGVILSVGLVVTVAVQSGMVAQRFADMGGAHNSLTWRVLVWQGVLDRDMDTQRLLVGHGLDTMIIDNQVERGKTAHSAYVATFHDCGMVGLTALLVLFGAMIAAPLKMLRQHWADRRLRAMNSFAFLLACGFVLLSITEEPLSAPPVTIYYWTVLVICHLESNVGAQRVWRAVEMAPAALPEEAELAYAAARV
jgi:hypothetical protein